MMAFAGGLAVITFLFGYLVGHSDGKESALDLYVDEQNKRIAAESEIKHLKRTRIALEDNVIDLQKKLARTIPGSPAPSAVSFCNSVIQ